MVYELRLHRIQIIETGDLSTERLFGLCLGLLTCTKNGRWPSVATANTFFKRGFDDGELGTDIKWEPFELSEDKYRHVIKSVMDGREYTFDNSVLNWDDWQENTAIE